jgi:hypothetical protein
MDIILKDRIFVRELKPCINRKISYCKCTEKNNKYKRHFKLGTGHSYLQS